MLQDLVEQWQIMRQAFAPMRLTRWQLTKMFAAQVNRDHPIAAKAIVVFGLVAFLWMVNLLTRPKRLEKQIGLPVLKGSKTLKNDFASIIEYGRQKYGDNPYIVNVNGLQYVVYPPMFFDEIKRLPVEEASAQDFFYKVTHGKYTHIGAETDALWKAIGIDLARATPASVPTKQKDARIAFDQYVGYCPDYKPVSVFTALMKIVSMTNGASFVGREVGTGKWHDLVQQQPMAVYFAIMSLSWVPRLLRPLFEPLLLLPAMKVEREMRRILDPVIKKDLEEYESAKDKRELLRAKENERLPFTKWLIARYKPGEATPRQLATDQIVTSFESTVSTAVSMYNVLFNIAGRPEIQDELRRELQEVMVDGKLPTTTLKELKKMDSVMRESFRVNPFALFSLYRVARQPLQLSSGPKLPAGTILCVDSHHINKSAELFPEPQTYDPYRFLKKRAEPGNEHRYQFVSTGPEDPNFGDGVQACPGRFFANNTLKVCLTHVLLNYNVRFKEGQERPKMVSMPNGSWVPDLKAELLFQTRE